MKVLALHFAADKTPSSPQIYRANMPLYVLGQHSGWQCEVEQWGNILAERAQYGIQAFVALAQAYDLFIFPRMTVPKGATLDALKPLFTLIRMAGKHIVYEVDDDFSNLYRDIGADGAMALAAWCDAITVTTPYLSQWMERWTHRPTFVLPNMLHPDIWRKPENRLFHEGLVIGLSGSPTHSGDWQVLETVLPRILEENPTVRLRMTGFHPPYLQELPRTDYLPPNDYSGYAEIVRSCDVILAPVDPHDEFNRSKSPIKVIEGMGATRPLGNSHAGAACIATDNQVYRLAIEQEQNGLLVEHTSEGWYQGLTRIIRDEALRTKLQLQAHRSVWKRFDVTIHWTLWARAYQKIVSRPINRVTMEASS